MDAHDNHGSKLSQRLEQVGVPVVHEVKAACGRRAKKRRKRSAVVIIDVEYARAKYSKK